MAKKKKAKKKTGKGSGRDLSCRACGDVPCTFDFLGCVFHLDLPDRRLCVNSHTTHYMGLSGMKKIHRTIAESKASYWAKFHRPMLLKATLQPAFYFKDRRGFKDKDNLWAWIKTYIDGIEDAGLVINDRVIEPLPPTQFVKEKHERERVELTLLKV